MFLNRAGRYFVLLSLLIVLGCGESTQEKMMRIAKERAKRNAVQRAEEEAQQDAITDQVAATNPDAPTAATPTNSDQANSDQAGRDANAGADGRDKVSAADRQRTPRPSDPLAEEDLPTDPIARKAALARARERRDEAAEAARRRPIASRTSAAAAGPSQPVAIGPDGQRVAYVGANQVVGVFDSTTGSPGRPLFNPQMQPTHVAVGESRRWLVAGGVEGSFKVYDLRSLRGWDQFELSRLIQNDLSAPRPSHTGPIGSVDVHDASGLVAIGGNSGEVKLWAAEPRPPISLAGNQADCIGLVMTSENQLISIHQKGLTIWNSLDPGSNPAVTLASATGVAAADFAIDPSGRVLAVGDIEGRISLWDTSDWKRPAKTFAAHVVPIGSVGFEGDGRTLVTVAANGEVARWPLSIKQSTVFDLVDPPAFMITSSDGGIVGVPSRGENLDLYSSETGKAVRRHTVAKRTLRAAAFSDDDSMVAMVDDQGRVWFQDQDRRPVAYLDVSGATISHAMNLAGRDALALVADDGKVMLANFPRLVDRPTVRGNGKLSAISPDGRWLLESNDSSELRLVDLIGQPSEKSEQTITIDESADARVVSIAVGDSVAVAGCDDGRVHVWQLDGSMEASPSQPIVLAKPITTSAFESSVIAVGAASDGDGKVRLIACDASGKVKTWAVAGSDSPGDGFTVGTEPRSISIVDGFVVAVDNELVSVFGKAGASLGSFSIAETSADLIAGHPTGRHVAVCTRGGSVRVIAASVNATTDGVAEPTAKPSTMRLPIDAIVSIVWSGDGRHLAATDGNRIVVIDADTNQLVAQWVIGGSITELVAWDDQSLWCRQAKGELVGASVPRTRWTFDAGGPCSLAIRGEGDSIAVAGVGGTLWELDPSTGTPVNTIDSKRDELRSIVPVPNTDKLAMLAGESEIVMFGGDGKLTPFATVDGIRLETLRFSGWGDTAYAGDSDGKLLAWKLSDIDAQPRSVPCEVDGDLMASASNNRLLVAPTDRGKLAALAPRDDDPVIARVGNELSSSALSPDASIVAITDQSDRVTVLTLAGGETQSLASEGHAFGKVAIGPGLDGGLSVRVAALARRQASDGMAIVVWDTSSPTPIGQTELDTGATNLRFSPDGESIVVGFDNGKTQIIDARTITVAETLAPEPSSGANAGRVTFASVTDESKVMIAGDDGSVRIESLQSVGRWDLGDDKVVAVRFSRDGTRILCGTEKGKIELWNRSDLTKPEMNLRNLGGLVRHVEFAPDGRHVLAVFADADSSTMVWDLEKTLTNPTATTTLTRAESPAPTSEPGGLAEAKSDDQDATQRDAPEAEIAPQPGLDPILKIAGQLGVGRADVDSSPATCATFMFDASFVLIGGVDGTIRAHAISDGRQVARFPGHRGTILALSRKVAAAEGSVARAASRSATPLPPIDFVSVGEDLQIRSWAFPPSLPGPGADAIESLPIDQVDIAELSPPEITERLRVVDPMETARRELNRGADRSQVFAAMAKAMASSTDEMKDATDELAALNQSLEAVDRLRFDPQSDPASRLAGRRRVAELRSGLDRSRSNPTGPVETGGLSNLFFAADTHFVFGPTSEHRPIKMKFADQFLFAARASVMSGRNTSNRNTRRRITGPRNSATRATGIDDNGDDGSLVSWDYRDTGLQNHEWRIDELWAESLLPLSDPGSILVVPQMTLLGRDAAVREMPPIATWATFDGSMKNAETSSGSDGLSRLLAIGTGGANRVEDDILKVYNLDQIGSAATPIATYRSFEGTVTAMAMANHSPTIAFSVRERAVHRLFVADARTMRVQKIEEINHDQPYSLFPQTSRSRTTSTTARESLRTAMTNRNRSAPPGVTTLAFSPDDETLLVHGQYDQSLHKLSMWKVQWDDAGQISSIEKNRRELESKGQPFFIESEKPAVRFVAKPTETRNFRRILVRVEDGYSLVNVNSEKAEQTIKLLETHRGEPPIAITDDGRWIAMGDDSGMAYIWDTLEGDRYSVTMTTAIEDQMSQTTAKLRDVRDRPAHAGPVAGIAMSEPDPGQDYPAFVATIGEENKVRVWQMQPILDSETGLRARN